MGFRDNLNFICNFEYNEDYELNGGLKYIEAYLEDMLKTFNSDIVELKGNKFKLIKHTKNIQEVIKTFKQKISKFSESIEFLKKKSHELLGSVKTKEYISDSFLKKSEILFEKLTYKIVEMEFIKKIVKSIKGIFENIGDLSDDFEPTLLIKSLKMCLRETEEYNITKLKHAQKKFYLSRELGDFMYGKKNPKLAHLLSLDSSVPVDADEVDEKGKVIKSAIPSKLMTPFGPVWVKKKSDKSRMIYLIYSNQQCSKALKYNEMCEQLDVHCEYDEYGLIKLFHGKLEYSMEDMIDTIKVIMKYINQPLSKIQNYLGVNDMPFPELLFGTVKHNQTIPKLTPEQKEAAAFLCGVLLLSESHEVRNPTGGKFERKAMKNVLRLAKNGCVNPFSKVFSNAKGRYIPAHDKGEETGDLFPGGQRQASILIDLHEINIRYFLTNSEFDRNKKKSTAEEFERDFIAQIKSVGGIEIMKNALNSLRNGNIPKSISNNQNLKKITNDIKKGFLFIQKFKNANQDTTFNIDELPDKPGNSLLAKIKIITKAKNIKRMNKLMNNSI